MYKILVIQITMVLQTLCDESVLHNRTSETKGLEVVQKDFLATMIQEVDEAIDHQQNSNATEPMDVPKLKELKEMLRTVNGTDLEDLQAQHKDAMRHGRLDMTLADMAKVFAMKKQKQLKLKQEGDATRERMRNRINRWVKREQMKKQKAKAKSKAKKK